MSNLPSNPQERKGLPIGTGVLDYFPDALAAIAKVSKIGNDQHNPGQPLHWDRSKSTDESDAMIRHYLERGTIDSDGARHSAKMAWRALAFLQKEIETATRKDPDDKSNKPPEAPVEKPDLLEWASGGHLNVPYGENLSKFYKEQTHILSCINSHLFFNYTATLKDNQNGSTTVDLSSVSDPAGKSFMVWGALQRASDRERREVQPRPDDSSQSHAAFRNALKNHQSYYEAGCTGKD